MAIDLNADMGEMIKGLLKKKEGGAATGQRKNIIAKIRPFGNAIIFFVVTLILFGAYIKAYYMPMKESNEKKTVEIERLKDMQQQITQLDSNITNMKRQLNESREHYIESLSHFGNSEDLGELYQSISTLASKYDLVVLNIKEDEATKAAPKKDNNVPADGDQPVKKKKTEVKEIVVDAELKGSYAQYIRFKDDLSVAEMLLKINEETIKVRDDEQGQVFISLNLSTYAIDKKPFQDVIGEEEEARNEK